MAQLAWITGAAGLIGNQLVQLAPALAPGFRIRPITRNDLDLTNHAAVAAAFAAEQPALIIHCAAMSKSPACQANPALARAINTDATQHLAKLAQDRAFVFFSTDLVFDGRQGNYSETDAPHPLSIYAETKDAAENAVLQNSHHLVIRTSINYGHSPTGDRSFNEEMAAAWRAGRALNLFTDEFRSPIPAEATARAMWELVQHNAHGIYHVAGAEKLSRHRIGELVATKYAALQPKIVPGSLRDYQGAPRSPDTSLNSAKAQALLSFPLPRFSEWLATHD